MTETSPFLPPAVTRMEVCFVKDWWVSTCEGFRFIYRHERRTVRCLVWRPAEMTPGDYRRLAEAA